RTSPRYAGFPVPSAMRAFSMTRVGTGASPVGAAGPQPVDPSRRRRTEAAIAGRRNIYGTGRWVAVLDHEGRRGRTRIHNMQPRCPLASRGVSFGPST